MTSTPAKGQEPAWRGYAETQYPEQLVLVAQHMNQSGEVAFAQVRIAPGAQVDESAVLSPGTTVWELAQIREEAVLGCDCVVGRGVYVGPGVKIGHRVKIQNHALVYEPAELADGVFVGPAVVLTNDRNPRAVGADGRLKRAGDWEAVGVRVAEGASLGARSVCVAPVGIGRWAMVAAGAVVTKDVPDFALVAGVPARQIGWVGPAGERLRALPDRVGLWECPSNGNLYSENDGILTELSAQYREKSNP